MGATFSAPCCNADFEATPVVYVRNGLADPANSSFPTLLNSDDPHVSAKSAARRFSVIDKPEPISEEAKPISEEAKARQAMQRDKILLQWAHGDKKGLIETSMRAWKQAISKEPKAISGESKPEPVVGVEPEKTPEDDEDDGTPEENKCYFDSELESLPTYMRNFVLDGVKRTHQFESGAKYYGLWQSNKRHGRGMQTWPDGATYEGVWCNNKAEGPGLFEYPNGDVYIGQWQSNLAHGVGTLIRHDGFRYWGEWANDKQEGFGVEVCAAGHKYEGNFKGGEKTGYGVYTWVNGQATYEGAWDSGKQQGPGSMRFEDGGLFKGTWNDGVMHGIGCYAWPDGRTYCGQYSSDLPDGFGVMTTAQQQKYEGYWRNGKRHGPARQSTRDGKSVTSRFDAGELCGSVASNAGQVRGSVQSGTGSTASGKRSTRIPGRGGIPAEEGRHSRDRSQTLGNTSPQ